LDYSPLTAAETPEFICRAAGLLTDEERTELIQYLAEHPKGGDLILLTVYAKGERDDLSADDRRAFAALARHLVAIHKGIR